MAHHHSTQPIDEQDLIAGIALVAMLVITLAIVVSIFVRSL